MYHWLACSRCLVSTVRCSNGGGELNRTRRKRGESGASYLPFPFSLPFFFLRQFFDRALLSELLEQANQGLALPKVEAPGQTRHPPLLSDAFVKEGWNIS